LGPATVEVYNASGVLVATLCADAAGTRFELYLIMGFDAFHPCQNPEELGNVPNELARRAQGARPTVIFPFRRRVPRARVRRDCAMTDGCAEKIGTRNRDRRRNNGREYRGDC